MTPLYGTLLIKPSCSRRPSASRTGSRLMPSRCGTAPGSGLRPPEASLRRSLDAGDSLHSPSASWPSWAPSLPCVSLLGAFTEAIASANRFRPLRPIVPHGVTSQHGLLHCDHNVLGGLRISPFALSAAGWLPRIDYVGRWRAIRSRASSMVERLQEAHAHVPGRRSRRTSTPDAAVRAPGEGDRGRRRGRSDSRSRHWCIRRTHRQGCQS